MKEVGHFISDLNKKCQSLFWEKEQNDLILFDKYIILVIELSVLLRHTDSYDPFGIFKLLFRDSF